MRELKDGPLHSLLLFALAVIMQIIPVCRLRNQFLPFGYEAFCDLSSYFMFPKRIHSLPHSSFLRENKTKWRHGHTDHSFSHHPNPRFTYLIQQHNRVNEILCLSLKALLWVDITGEVPDILLYFVCMCSSVSCRVDFTFTAVIISWQLQPSDLIGQKHVEAVLIIAINHTWRERKSWLRKGLIHCWELHTTTTVFYCFLLE